MASTVGIRPRSLANAAGPRSTAMALKMTVDVTTASRMTAKKSTPWKAWPK
jgi:hypothetical protein